MILFQIIYALIAMSLIKPAEKFFRDIFGMNGKVSSTASHESGKAFMDSTAKLVKDIATVVATAATGGAAAFASGGLKGFAKNAVGNLATQDGVGKLMNLKGSADGFANGLSSGVADAGAKEGFFSQQVRDWNKKRNENQIDDIAANKDSLRRLSEKLYRETYQDMYGNEKRERDAAEQAAKAKLKSLASKYVPYGFNDLDTMLELDKISKETGMTNTEKIIAEYRKRKGKQNKEDSIALILEGQLIKNIQDSKDSSYTIVGKDGQEIVLTMDDISSGKAREVLREKAKYIIESGSDYRTLKELNIEARDNYIFEQLKGQLREEMTYRGGKCEITGKNGDRLEVTRANIDSEEVREAIMSKLKYIEGRDDKKISNITVGIDELARCENLARIEIQLGKKQGKDKAVMIDKKIEQYRSIETEQRQKAMMSDKELDDKARKIIASEIERRESMGKKTENMEEVYGRISALLKQAVEDGGGTYTMTVGNNVNYKVNSGNVSSQEVLMALASKVQFIEGIHDTDKRIDVSKFNRTTLDELERLDRTRARLETSSGEVVNASAVKKFDEVIGKYMKSDEKVQRRVLNGYNTKMKQILIDEVEARN